MKKKIYFFIVLLFASIMMLFIFGCQTISESEYKYESILKESETTYNTIDSSECDSSDDCSENVNVDMKKKDMKDIYQTVCIDIGYFQLGDDYEFGNLVCDNPIDSDYYEEVCELDTKPISDTEKEYTDIWKLELEYSADRLCEILTDEEKQRFFEIQAQWEDYVSKSSAFESSILLENDVELGSAYIWICQSNLRNIYRERTLKIKYLHYVLERDLLNKAGEYDNCTYESVIFLYKS